MTGFAVYGTMTARPGQRAALIDEIRTAIAALDEPPGLLDYTINTVLDDPDALWITEVWTTKDAHDTATRTTANKARTARFAELLAAAPHSAYGEIVDRLDK
ncbi:MAG TPA: antibiotic biosynthesis monooxygenase family protein [Pseudonocardiaceae bacterium]|jgi:quinol monooxygenase YgiN|nr:antibiotic biosynthesis monooxygenase family protein [Pseudonocardiaceae bacterium]